MSQKYKLYGGGHNEIYDLLDKMRYKENKKFDYVCSDEENDDKYLDLTCIEAKLLKYILQVNFHADYKERHNFIQNNILNTYLLRDYLTNINTYLDKIPNKINTIIASKSEKSTKSIGDKLGDKVLIGLWNIFRGAATPLALLFSGTKGVREMWNINTSLEKLNINELKQIQEIIGYIQGICRNIINKLKLEIESIDVTNICVNGTKINNKSKREHKKCNNDDYKGEYKDTNNKTIKVNMDYIKQFFKVLETREYTYSGNNFRI